VADVLLSGDENGIVNVWDTATCAKLHTLSGQGRSVMSVAFDASGALAATAVFNGQIRLYDVRAGWQSLRTIQVHTDWCHFRGLQFFPTCASGPPLLVSASGKTAKLWDVRDARQPRLTLRCHSDDVMAVSFSPDGALLATGSTDNSVALWRVADGALLRKFASDKPCEVWSVAFHPRDASVLATWGPERRLKLWQL
jgi:WD40 repeat protein